MPPAALPFLRFDPRLERKWFHRYQHLYMWLMYPFLQVVFQIGDWKASRPGSERAVCYSCRQADVANTNTPVLQPQVCFCQKH